MATATDVLASMISDYHELVSSDWTGIDEEHRTKLMRASRASIHQYAFNHGIHPDDYEF